MKITTYDGTQLLTYWVFKCTNYEGMLRSRRLVTKDMEYKGSRQIQVVQSFGKIFWGFLYVKNGYDCVIYEDL